MRLGRCGVVLLGGAREQKRHAGVGITVSLRHELLRPVKDDRLSRGGIVCRGRFVEGKSKEIRLSFGSFDETSGEFSRPAPGMLPF